MLLTNEQRCVRRRLIRNRGSQQVQTLGGFAGVGKTTVLAALAEALPDWAPCAFTGRAAHVMRGKGIRKARTIHSVIYTPSLDGGGLLRFVLRDKAELSQLRGFLVDEASMVGQDLYTDLLSFGLPVIFVGDHGQLPPVGDDVNLMAKPDYRLETVHRNAGEIAFFAQHLRHGRHPRSFQTGGAVSLLSQRRPDDDLLSDAGQVIVAFNKTRVDINASVRRLRGFTGLVEPGDRIICLRNHYASGLFNGMMGQVLSVDSRRQVMDFQSGGSAVHRGLCYEPDTFGAEKPELRYDPDSPHPFDHAYAITAHKAQGGEWPRVTVIEQWCPYWEGRRWAYTAASRAQQSLTWVSAPRRVPVAARGHATSKGGCER
jgi:exodeoxyribonuclease-5